MIEDFYLLGNGVMRREAAFSDLERYTRLEYGTSDTTWLVRSVPARRAPTTPNGGRKGWASRARVLVAKVAAFLHSPRPPSRAPGPLSDAVVHKPVAEGAVDAAMFLATPRRRQTVDTSELGRYSRLEFGDADPSWIVWDPVEEERRHRMALERWLRGDDQALEEWLTEPPRKRPRRIEVPVAA